MASRKRLVVAVALFTVLIAITRVVVAIEEFILANLNSASVPATPGASSPSRGGSIEP